MKNLVGSLIKIKSIGRKPKPRATSMEEGIVAFKGAARRTAGNFGFRAENWGTVHRFRHPSDK